MIDKPLTVTQLCMVVALAQSKPRNEIAKGTNLSPKTVDYHLANAARTLGLAGSNDVAGFTRWAISQRLVKP